MIGRAALLGLLLVCVAAGTANSGLLRQPSCPDTEVLMCPMNYAPVCGSDGNTYGNECQLCAQRQMVKMDILIAKEGNC